MVNTVDQSNLEIKIHLDNEYGLHARPAAVLAKEAQKFSSEIQLCFDGREVDAKSILDILTLAVPHGGSLSIRASGADAREAVKHIKKLINGRFEGNK
ncbi:MAG: HPr family phosphocarrier protein [Desulfonatronovibrio sp. MSAO_Bac4]|nr:MAG: HPr family phosphocarrier protein [Desulfonatronovibrio sp. MSAO_Bac4]